MKHLIILTALTCLAIRGFAQNNPPPPTQGRPPTMEELRVADPVDGLGNRPDLIRFLCHSDSDFVFKQIKDAGGQPTFQPYNNYNHYNIFNPCNNPQNFFTPAIEYQKITPYFCSPEKLPANVGGLWG